MDSLNTKRMSFHILCLHDPDIREIQVNRYYRTVIYRLWILTEPKV